ncbi:betaine/proline/choline family ABC transporter ATP-binding protein [uncultured Cetobacterium sp.]|uniref:betaine/proline/choline family ABC transporter ATP-binding protein n=1 Tax=uncultured Cetobacterium sp. TaxID=527638 RepID=UPI0025E552B1|nr:betaine/proline/choline family ABC transporter ATP-binding protein [uncultured Cetobacterium sp.]
MIEFKKVTKSYDKNTLILKNIDFKVKTGEFVVLIGESGCGKTTTMKLINRLIDPSNGIVLIDGEDISKVDPIILRRRIGYVIQKEGLMPHMTIGENIELVPKLLKWEKDKRKSRAFELLQLLNLDPEIYYDKYPHEVSGGQKQRVGIARALATNPDIILMDEPFSALDPITRESIQDEVLKLQKELGKTIIFVTHDMDEAIKLGEKIAFLKDGEILQFGTPDEILKNPASEYIEQFIGKDRIWKTPKKLLVSDIMSKQYWTIEKRSNISRAFNLLKTHDTDFLIVTESEAGKHSEPIGIIFRKNLVHAMENNILRVREVMDIDFSTIDKDSNLLDVLNKMSSENAKVMPVVDCNNRLTGVITNLGLVNAISKIAPSPEFQESIDEGGDIL